MTARANGQDVGPTATLPVPDDVVPQTLRPAAWASCAGPTAAPASRAIIASTRRVFIVAVLADLGASLSVCPAKDTRAGPVVAVLRTGAGTGRPRRRAAPFES